MKTKLLLLLLTFAVVCMQAQDVENAEPLSAAAMAANGNLNEITPKAKLKVLYFHNMK